GRPTLLAARRTGNASRIDLDALHLDGVAVERAGDDHLVPGVLRHLSLIVELVDFIVGRQKHRRRAALDALPRARLVALHVGLRRAVLVDDVPREIGARGPYRQRRSHCTQRDPSLHAWSPSSAMLSETDAHEEAELPFVDAVAAGVRHRLHLRESGQIPDRA